MLPAVVLVFTLAGSAMSQATCATICKPVMQLLAGCKAQTAPLSSTAEECVCTNVSFDVSTIGGLCMSCLMMNKMPNPALMQLSPKCPFEEASYVPQADALVQGVVVQIPAGKAATSTGAAVATRTATMTGVQTGAQTGGVISMGGMSGGWQDRQFNTALALAAMSFVLSSYLYV